MYFLTLSSYWKKLPWFTEYIFPFSGHLIFGWLKQNSPMEVSSVKPFTPLRVAYTSIVEEPYTIYPAATCTRPGCKKSSLVTVLPFGVILLYTLKIVPMETFTSILPLPSNGSYKQTYFEFLLTSSSKAT